MQNLLQQKLQNLAINLPDEHGGESSISSHPPLEFSEGDDALLLIGKLRRVLAHDHIWPPLCPLDHW